MPELPEVQTVVSDLNRKIKGDVITDFWSEWPKAINGKSLDAFKKEIKGRKVLEARRIGKNIFIDLSGGKTLYIHLKMTGHLLIKQKAESNGYFSDRVNQYIRHIFHIGKDKTMEFSDMRKFGKIVLDDTEKISELKEVKKLGIDAMSAEFTFRKFNEILDRKQKAVIGILLMDQETISGIGNIYRSEVLYDADISPKRKAADLSLDDRKRLYDSIRRILKLAIKLRGTSDSDYRDTSGAPGGFQKVMKVYKQQGKKCGKCGGTIEREKMGQRSVFFCPGCQA
ncbi:MAG: bifunctional DNA-formamidopyrimidine glycosylase/DNA-(apurinic or apyrimidinic site) lyase [Candidatus Moranbacteria bacterium]|nr:bifunctional DNA-formamidopyrimidine glycosylase/DNA-(apurinic or apyrimidinic site) lyase [Candidatus Moranbacteria bacterium]